MKRIATALLVTAVTLGIPTTAHAADEPDPNAPIIVVDQGHTSTACLYERYWTAEACPGVTWQISKAQEAAQAAPIHIKRTWKPKHRHHVRRWHAVRSHWKHVR